MEGRGWIPAFAGMTEPPRCRLPVHTCTCIFEGGTEFAEIRVNILIKHSFLCVLSASAVQSPDSEFTVKPQYPDA